MYDGMYGWVTAAQAVTVDDGMGRSTDDDDDGRRMVDDDGQLMASLVPALAGWPGMQSARTNVWRTGVLAAAGRWDGTVR